jgi:hypothetical protein
VEVESRKKGVEVAMGKVPRLVIWTIDNPIQSPCHEKFKFPSSAAFVIPSSC